MRKVYYPHPLIAKEGWVIIAFSLALMLVAYIFNVWAGLVFTVLVIFVIQFFRDPKRGTPNEDHIAVCPADGRIVSIVQAQDPYANREALKISIFMNVFNVHSNRMPVSGKIVDIQYIQGQFFNADLDKASIENERNAVVIQTPYGLVTSVQVAGLVARRIIHHISKGDELKIGERYGMIRFGSRVDVYLPLEASPAVRIGQKVTASTTVLARFPQ